MGLIKAALSATSSAFGDQFKEFVECPQINNDVIIQRGIVKHGDGNKNYSEGVISNGSTIAVPQGMAMMIIDNGKIVEFSAEPGTYTWETSSESSIFTGGFGEGLKNTFKTLGTRFTYGGQEAKDQRVYFVNIKTIPGNMFGSSQPEVVADPVYGSVEITYNGEYSIKIVDPIILVNNVIGANPKDTLTYDDIFKTQDGRNMLKSKFAEKVSVAIANIMLNKNISFNRIQAFKSDVTDEMNDILDEDWKQKYGIIVEDVTLRVNASEKSRQIVQEMDAEVARTTRMGQVYSSNMQGAMAAASAEAMKNAASNENGAMAGFMGMGMSQMQGANIMGAVAGMQQNNSQTTQSNNIQENNNSTWKCSNCGKENTGKFCMECGNKKEEEKICSKCGYKLNENSKFCPECGNSLA